MTIILEFLLEGTLEDLWRGKAFIVTVLISFIGFIIISILGFFALAPFALLIGVFIGGFMMRKVKRAAFHSAMNAIVIGIIMIVLLFIIWIIVEIEPPSAYTMDHIVFDLGVRNTVIAMLLSPVIGVVGAVSRILLSDRN